MHGWATSSPAGWSDRTPVRSVSRGTHSKRRSATSGTGTDGCVIMSRVLNQPQALNRRHVPEVRGVRSRDTGASKRLVQDVRALTRDLRNASCRERTGSHRSYVRTIVPATIFAQDMRRERASATAIANGLMLTSRLCTRREHPPAKSIRETVQFDVSALTSRIESASGHPNISILF